MANHLGPPSHQKFGKENHKFIAIEVNARTSSGVKKRATISTNMVEIVAK